MLKNADMCPRLDLNQQPTILCLGDECATVVRATYLPDVTACQRQRTSHSVRLHTPSPTLLQAIQINSA